MGNQARYWRRNIVLYAEHRMIIAQVRQKIGAKSDSATIRYILNRVEV